MRSPRRSLQEELADAMSWRCLYEALVGGSGQVLVSASCQIRYSSSRPFFDDPASFSLKGSGTMLLLTILCEALQ